MAPRDTDSDLLKLINDSGFPFQMAVTWQITQSTGVHGWKVLAEEHPWKHPESGREGFVDQILQHRLHVTFRAIVECKRSSPNGNGKWQFLTPPEGSPEMSRLSVFWAHGRANEKAIHGWHDFLFTPKSPETSFCVVSGDDAKRPMFERIADGLLPATESIGLEEMGLLPKFREEFTETRFYLPVVVTNARLYTAAFSPATLDMTTGRLPTGACNFTETPCVRFRKSLGTHVMFRREFQSTDRHDAITRVNQASQRTILIFNSASLGASLEQLRIADEGMAAFEMMMNQLTSRLRPSI